MREALGTETLKAIYARIAAGYDLRHTLLTARSDARGRALLVEATVKEGDRVLDCGAGTGSTGLQAARRVGPEGAVTFFDLSEEMLSVAKRKAEGCPARLSFRTGDLTRLPFEDGSFDVVLSSYSLCPVASPARGAVEIYRVTRPGGLVGVAHSAEAHPLLRPLAEWIEALAWRFPALSMGCRAVEVLPALTAAGGRVVLSRRIGVPLWPFEVFVVEKPAAEGGTRP